MIPDETASLLQRKLAILTHIKKVKCPGCDKFYLPSTRGRNLCDKCVRDGILIVDMTIMVPVPLERITINLKIDDTGTQFVTNGTETSTLAGG